MALFRATVKAQKYVNGIRLEKGMTVDFSSIHSQPLITNGGKEVVDAFMRRYGIDLTKAFAVNSNSILIEKIS